MLPIIVAGAALGAFFLSGCSNDESEDSIQTMDISPSHPHSDAVWDGNPHETFARNPNLKATSFFSFCSYKAAHSFFGGYDIKPAGERKCEQILSEEEKIFKEKYGSDFSIDCSYHFGIPYYTEVSPGRDYAPPTADSGDHIIRAMICTVTKK